MSKKLNVIIMAGGLGKRMNSDLPKVLHCIKGKPMLVRVLEQSLLLNPDKGIPTLNRCAEYGRMRISGGMLPHPELERF